jgi:hypothetical protein
MQPQVPQMTEASTELPFHSAVESPQPESAAHYVAIQLRIAFTVRIVYL